MNFFDLYKNLFNSHDLRELKRIINFTDLFPEGVKTFPFKKRPNKKK